MNVASRSKMSYLYIDFTSSLCSADGKGAYSSRQPEHLGLDSGRLQPRAKAEQKGRWAMNGLDRFMEYLVAGVFPCVVIGEIIRHKRRPRPLGAQSAGFPFGLSYGSLVAIGIFQIVAAWVLVAPLSSFSTIAPWAAAGLVFVTLGDAMYHMRRHESAVPNLILFLLVAFVVVGRWM
jgi:DoxX-like family